MNMLDILHKKREGETLNREEINYFIQEYCEGNIPDYQAAAFLMAIFFQGLNGNETWWMTEAMMSSGEQIDLSAINGIKVDKHSTGGVGDKTTLIAGPLTAACGVSVAKMSGRGLGFTGGTIDKLESIPGFRTDLTMEQFLSQVNEIGISIIGATSQIAKADKLIYALRDVTDTVDVLSLITSSIMSKKLASGSNAIVLDVKWGKGAFMQSVDEARTLARMMVEIGTKAGKKIIALITDMEQPLGLAVGNRPEIIEAIQVLKGTGPKDITELSLHLAGHMIFLGGKASTPEEGMKMAEAAMKEGTGLKKFAEMVQWQGGNTEDIFHESKLPKAKYTLPVVSEREGYVFSLNAKIVGKASQVAGAGRVAKNDIVDLSAGIQLNKKTGDKIDNNETLAEICGEDYGKLKEAAQILLSAYKIHENPGTKKPLITEIIY